MRSFEETKRIHERVEMVLALLRGKARSEVLTHAEAADAIGFEPPHDTYYYIMTKACRRFEAEDGVSTLADPTVGYRLLTPEEQIGEVARRGRRARRQVKRGLVSLEALPTEGLDPHLVHLHSAMRRHAVEMSATIQRDARFAARLLGPRRAAPMPVLN